MKEFPQPISGQELPSATSKEILDSMLKNADKMGPNKDIWLDILKRRIPPRMDMLILKGSDLTNYRFVTANEDEEIVFHPKTPTQQPSITWGYVTTVGSETELQDVNIFLNGPERKPGIIIQNSAYPLSLSNKTVSEIFFVGRQERLRFDEVYINDNPLLVSKTQVGRAELKTSFGHKCEVLNKIHLPG